MRTAIIAAYAGAGKTYAAEHNDNIKCIDLDSSQFSRMGGDWQDAYVEKIKELVGKYDFIFIAQCMPVLAILGAWEIPFVLVIPNPRLEADADEQERIKQAWFERIKNRDNSHIANLPKFLKMLDEEWKLQTSKEVMKLYSPVYIHTLAYNEYLSDLLPTLHYRKESYAEYCANFVLDR